MTDLYPDEEGHISDGLRIGWCRSSAAIALHSGVFVDATAVSGEIMVTAGAVDGDSIGIALKEATAADQYIPVCFWGVVKFVAGEAFNEGDQIISDESATYGIIIETLTGGQMTCYRGLNYTGLVCRLGVALQAGAASGDEFLLLVGRVL